MERERDREKGSHIGEHQWDRSIATRGNLSMCLQEETKKYPPVKLFGRPKSHQAKISIINNISGIIKPGRLREDLVVKGNFRNLNKSLEACAGYAAIMKEKEHLCNDFWIPHANKSIRYIDLKMAAANTGFEVSWLVRWVHGGNEWVNGGCHGLHGGKHYHAFIIGSTDRGFRWIREHAAEYAAKINHNSKLKVIRDVRHVMATIGQDAQDDIKKSAFGRLLDFDSDARLCGVILHQIIARQFTFTGISEHEAWFRIGDNLICFGKQEFCLITGLKFGTSAFDTNAVYRPSDDGLWMKIFKGLQISTKDLWDRFKKGEFNENRDIAIKVALVLLAELVLMAGDGRGCVRSWVWELVDNRDAWDKFPWGKYVFQMTLHYLNKIQSPPPRTQKSVDKINYNFYGFPITLQVWAYEAIKELGDEFSDSYNGDDFLPRFLSPSLIEEETSYWENIEDDIRSGTQFVPPKDPIPGRSTISGSTTTAFHGNTDLVQTRLKTSMMCCNNRALNEDNALPRRSKRKAAPQLDDAMDVTLRDISKCRKDRSRMEVRTRVASQTIRDERVRMHTERPVRGLRQTSYQSKRHSTSLRSQLRHSETQRCRHSHLSSRRLRSALRRELPGVLDEVLPCVIRRVIPEILPELVQTLLERRNKLDKEESLKECHAKGSPEMAIVSSKNGNNDDERNNSEGNNYNLDTVGRANSEGNNQMDDVPSQVQSEHVSRYDERDHVSVGKDGGIDGSSNSMNTPLEPRDTQQTSDFQYGEWRFPLMHDKASQAHVASSVPKETTHEGFIIPPKKKFREVVAENEDMIEAETPLSPRDVDAAVQHMDAYCCLAAKKYGSKKVERQGQLGDAKKAVVDSNFFNLLKDEFFKLTSTDPKSVTTSEKPAFPSGLIDYVDGIQPWWSEQFCTVQSIIIVCNVNHHWITCEVHFSSWSITVYDSLMPRDNDGDAYWNERCMDLVPLSNMLPSLLMAGGYFEKLKMQPNLNPFKFIRPPSETIYHQDDIHSCGPLAMGFIKHLITGLPINLNEQNNIAAMRRRFALEIWFNSEDKSKYYEDYPR
ncbi:hypothetical protein PTKIN_Ptkin13bG0167000 [Pterospermum kingtungense]